jgi:hypothetical protein
MVRTALAASVILLAPTIAIGQQAPATGAPRSLPGLSTPPVEVDPKIAPIPSRLPADLDFMGFSPSADGEACLASFKAAMNDPSSLEVAGAFTFNDLASRTMSGVSIWPGYREVLVYTIPVRGRNGFGGLVLRSLWCTYGRTPDAKLTLLTFQTH